MCIVFIDLGSRDGYKLVVLSNRDEVFCRPTFQSTFWDPNAPFDPSNPSSTPSHIPLYDEETCRYVPTFPGTHILGGRDAICGGTWLGITPNGRFSVLTNFQEPLGQGIKPSYGEKPNPLDVGASNLVELKSRGDLVTNFLKTNISAQEYLESLRDDKEKYAGFNLIVGEGAELKLFSNRDPKSQISNLNFGDVYALTNGLIESKWYKVERGTILLKNTRLPDPDEVSRLAKKDDFFNILSKTNQTKEDKKEHQIEQIEQDESIDTKKTGVSEELRHLLKDLISILEDTQKPCSTKEEEDISIINNSDSNNNNNNSVGNETIEIENDKKNDQKNQQKNQQNINNVNINSQVDQKYHQTGRKSSIFVELMDTKAAYETEPRLYGTRCCIAILVDYKGRVTFYEKSLNVETNNWEDRVFHYQQ